MGPGRPELLHAVGELLLDGVGDEPASGSWPTYPIRSARSRGGGAHDAVPVEQHVAAQPAAAEARHQPGDDAEQRRLADAGATGDDDQLALLDGEVDAGRGPGGPRRSRP